MISKSSVFVKDVYSKAFR